MAPGRRRGSCRTWAAPLIRWISRPSAVAVCGGNRCALALISLTLDEVDATGYWPGLAIQGGSLRRWAAPARLRVSRFRGDAGAKPVEVAIRLTGAGRRRLARRQAPDADGGGGYTPAGGKPTGAQSSSG
jgi:hypothetical protein